MRLLLSWKPWTERRITDAMHSKVGKNYRRPVREGSLVTRGGGGGYTSMFYTGRLRREIQPLTHLCTVFGRKGTPYTHLASIDLCTSLL